MRRPKPWRDWTTVERADLYSKVSLIGLMWLFPLAVILQRFPTEAVDHGELVITSFFLVFILGIGTWGIAKPDFTWRKPQPASRPRSWWRQALLWGCYCYAPISLVYRAFTRHDPSNVTMLGVLFFVMAWLAGTAPGRWSAVAVFGIGLVIPIALTGRAVAGLLGLVGAGFVLFATRSSVWLRQVVRDLDEARTAQAELAVTEERLRFSRDVHDILGRRLSEIALQSELAARLAERGDDRAPEQMLAVRATAHDALREARELARGYRPIDLDQEVDGARSLLAAAGIELDARLAALPGEQHAAAAWVIRETLTNVLRHSDATRVVISWQPPCLVVVNDRPNPEPGASNGAGLVGLEERLTAAGGALQTFRDHDHFAVRARLPVEERQPAGASAP